MYLLPSAIFFILISSALTNFFLFLSFLFSFYHCVKNNNYKILLEKKIFKLCFILFFLFLLFSFQSIGTLEEIISILKKYIKFLYIPFIYYFIKIYNNEKIIINFFITGATIILIISYIKYFNLINFNYFYSFLKSTNIVSIPIDIIKTKSSIFQNYINHGIIFSFYSFLCLYMAKKNNSLIYYIFSLLAFLNVMFLSDSRTAYIILLILIIFSFFKIIANFKAKLVLVSIFSILLLTQFSGNLVNRINAINIDYHLVESKNYNSSLGKRLIWAKIGLENLINKPIFGFGTGSYKKTTINYFDNIRNNNKHDYITNNPHNEFISISSQLGIVGLIFFCSFLFFLFYESNGILSFGAAIVVVIASVFNSAFFDNILGIFLVILIGLLFQNKFKMREVQ